MKKDVELIRHMDQELNNVNKIKNKKQKGENIKCRDIEIMTLVEILSKTCFCVRRTESCLQDLEHLEDMLKRQTRKRSLPGCAVKSTSQVSRLDWLA